eukprot:11681132-Alexandrium_andersonii.AAC.1
MNTLLNATMSDDVNKRRQLYRDKGIIMGKSVEPKRGRKHRAGRDDLALDDEQDEGVRLAPAGAEPALAAVHAGAV